MSARGTKLAEAFSARVIQRNYAMDVAPEITNQDYEGDIKGVGSVVNVLTLDGMTIKNYTNSAMALDSLTESNCQLTTDQKKGFYFAVKDYDNFLSYIKNPDSGIVDEAAKKIKKLKDQFILSMYPDVGAGHRLGTDFTTGTVTVADTGVVTHSATGFTAAMAGQPFWAAGMVDAQGNKVWYRVKHYTSTSQIEIEDDKDDVASAYTGGAIGAGAAFIVQALTSVQVTKSTVYAQLNALGVMLDEAEVPDEDRWVVVPPAIAALIRQASEYIPAVPQAYQDVVLKGLVGELAGFKVWKSARVYGDATTGWHIMAGHKSGITMAEAMVEAKMEDDIPGDFGVAYKGLHVYGAKVIDERRKCLAELFGKL